MNFHGWFRLLLVVLLASVLAGSAANAQITVQDSGQSRRIEIIHADVFEFISTDSGSTRKLIGNVHLRDDSTDFLCDSALQDTGSNMTVAYGNVKILMGDSVTVTSDKLTYDGITKICILTGNVIMTQGKSSLRTEKLTWLRNENYGYYDTGGVLYDGKNELHSQKGTYHSKEKYARFKHNVLLTNPDYQLVTDTLGYNTELETAYFLAPTTVNDSINTMYTEDGYYDTKNKKALLNRNARISDTTYTLFGDTIIYDDSLKIGRAMGHVVAMEKDSGMAVYGTHGIFYSEKEESYITGNPYAMQFMEDDTLVLFADTLHSYRNPDTTKDERIFRAYRHVRIYMRKLQGRTDSLMYFQKDSVLKFFYDPVLWSDVNQIMGDTITVFMRKDKIDSLSIRHDGFIASEEDTLGYNQIKGINVSAKFNNNDIDKMWVSGNSETMYWAKDSTNYIGLNKAQCQDLFTNFKEGKPKRIVFYTSPKGEFKPLADVLFKDNFLEGFKWRVDERPERPVELLSEFSRHDSLLRVMELLRQDSLRIDSLKKVSLVPVSDTLTADSLRRDTFGIVSPDDSLDSHTPDTLSETPRLNNGPFKPYKDITGRWILKPEDADPAKKPSFLNQSAEKPKRIR